MVRFEATIHGVVQGVFFRYNTKQQADRLGIRGTVRNRPDRAVKVVAEGQREALDELLAWLHQGPPHAVVERVDVKWVNAAGECSGFWIMGWGDR